MDVFCGDQNKHKTMSSYYVDGQNYYGPHKTYLDQVIFILGNRGRSVKICFVPVEN